MLFTKPNVRQTPVSGVLANWNPRKKETKLIFSTYQCRSINGDSSCQCGIINAELRRDAHYGFGQTSVSWLQLTAAPSVSGIHGSFFLSWTTYPTAIILMGLPSGFHLPFPPYFSTILCNWVLSFYLVNWYCYHNLFSGTKLFKSSCVSPFISKKLWILYFGSLTKRVM